MKLSDLPPGENFLEPGQESHAAKRARISAEQKQDYKKYREGVLTAISKYNFKGLLEFVLDNLPELADHEFGGYDEEISQAVSKRHKELIDRDYCDGEP
jgi:hypothetical protein